MSSLDTLSQKPRLVSAEAISPEQSKWVAELIKISGARGVVVGALVGPESRDIYPLLLMGGQTWLLRAARSGSKKHSAEQLFNFYQQLSNAKLLSKDTLWGIGEGVFWVRRTFYQGPLDLRMVAGQSAYTEDAVQRLVSILRDIHKAGLAHGHICSSNVVFNAESPDWPMLVDFGFSFSDQSNDLNALSTAQGADIAGLAIVIEIMLTSDAQAQHRSILERMRDPDVAKRPSINEVCQVFLPRSSSSILPSSGRAINSSAVRSGRVISGPDSVVPKAESITERQPPAIASSKKSIISQVPNDDVIDTPRRETPELASHMVIPNPGSTKNNFLGPLIILLLALVGVFVYQRWYSNQLAEIPTTDRFAEYWSSNQRSLMSLVADSAVFDHDQTARMIVASDALKGVDHPGVQSRLIRVALSGPWESDFSETDRQIVMALALSGLISESSTGLPALNKANPAVAFSLAASLPLDSKADSLSTVSVSSLARMPQPYGSAFTTLVSTGVGTMQEAPSRALAHILAGDPSTEAIELYLNGTTEADQEFLRIKEIMPLSKVGAIADSLWSVLSKRPKGVGLVVNWFEQDQLQQWDGVSKEQKLGMLVGNRSLDGLRFEQIADLLVFPVAAVKQAALAELSSTKVFGDAMVPTLALIASGSHKFTRSQIVFLLSALKLKGESQFAYIAKWFSTSPDSESVLKLVLARKNIVTLDPLNVEATRYLQKNPFKATIADYTAMINHPEPLIRSLAYSKLNPAVPQEADLLRDMAKMEPSDKRRQLIEDKLNSAGKGLTKEHQK